MSENQSIIDKLQVRIQGLREQAVKLQTVDLTEYRRLREEAQTLDSILEAVKRGHDKIALQLITDGLKNLDNDELTSLVRALK